MNVGEQIYPNAVCGTQANVLNAIHQSEASIAIFQREVASLERDLAAAVEKGVNFQVSGEALEIAAALEVFFSENLPECQALLSDIQWVTDQFREVTNATSYRLLLSTISNNMCRKFHTDINDLRLLCTYSGPGTLWISGDELSDEEQPIGEGQIQQAGTGDVLILKGALYPDGNPIIHRSPTIEETGEKRLLLRLDTNSFLSL